MAIGLGLQNLMQSPMAGGQQEQFSDPTDIVKQLMEQFSEYVRKRQQTDGQFALGGRQGIQQPAQQSIQAPVGTPPRERAGRMRSAGMEGVGAFMEQAGETAAEPWKPQALDIGLMAATIALPIIAAMQPEGRGRRGQRKQERMSNLFKTLGGFAGQGLGMRMGSFQKGKEATFGAAETRAGLAGKEVTAKYGAEIGRIEAAESKRRWGREIGLAERGMAVKERPKLGKEPFTPSQLYRQGRDIAADARREWGQTQEDILVQANQIIQPLKSGVDSSYPWDIKSIQDLDSAIYNLQKRFPKTGYTPGDMPGSGYGIVQQLKNLRDQYYGTETSMLPMGGGQSGKPPDMTDAEWQEYLQMKGQ